MDSATWERLSDLFSRVLELPAGERRELLDRECDGDEAFRAEIEAMLAAGDEASEAPDIERRLLGELPPEAAPPGEGDGVGAWRLVRPLGRGGMGEVWLAERADGEFEQLAAVKLVRTGGYRPGLAARFRRERQLLARLVHPNIATLLDGGIAADGLPFLAMEFVDGEPITAWCDARALGVRERLELFGIVCDAVHFAHVNLVVHRDLKPANILVARDGHPVLLDFGIAKLLEPDDGGAGETRPDDRLLTPEYAAPEQLRGEPITTATDVWGLGLLLFELLTGGRAYDVAGKDAAAIERIVCEAEAPRPSAAVESPERRRALRGDLDQIVRTALHREPERRYASAEALAEDIRRHLAGLPVHAQADTLAYRVGKFVRRHRVPVGAAAVVASLVLLFGVSSWRQARLLARERDRAVAARESSEAVTGALVDLLRVADPRRMPGGDTLRVADLLVLGEERMRELEAEPAARARLWETFAELHAARSRYREERVALDEAIAALAETGSVEDRLRLRHARALNTLRLDGVEAARPLLEESLAAHEACYGPEHPEVAVALQHLSDAVSDPEERRVILERALAITTARFPESSIEVAAAWNALGTHYWRTSDPAAASRAFARSLRSLEGILPAEHPDLLTVRQNLAVCRQRSGDFPGAEAELRQLLGIRRRVVGPQTQEVATTLQNIGVLLANQGRHAEAAECLGEVLRITRGIFGAEHVQSARAMHDYGLALAYDGHEEEGFAIADSAAVVLDRVGGGSGQVREVRISRLRTELAVGRDIGIDAARSLLEELSAALAADHHSVCSAHALVAAVLLGSGPEASAAEAERHFDAALAGFSRGTSPDHPLPSHAACGREAARALAGLPYDRDALAGALARCERWGLAQPVVLRRAREVLAAGR